MNNVEMRKAIIKLYPHDKWLQKVKKMSDEQVLAIYLKNQDKIKKLYKAADPVETLNKIFDASDAEFKKTHEEALDATWGYYGQE